MCVHTAVSTVYSNPPPTMLGNLFEAFLSASPIGASEMDFASLKSNISSVERTALSCMRIFIEENPRGLRAVGGRGPASIIQHHNALYCEDET